MVKNCSDEADDTWTAHSGFAQWVVHWDVCPRHWELLDSNHAWAPDYGQGPSWQRTILMGGDLEQDHVRLFESALAKSE